MNKKNFFKTSYGIITLSAILLLTVFIALRLGSVYLDFKTFLNALMLKDGYFTQSLIIYNIRLPRIIGALLAGVGLSLSGMLLQGVTGNSLAGPNIIGINSGAGFAVILSMFLVPKLTAVIPFSAFIGAFIAAILIVFTASKVNASKSTVILVGIAFTAMINAGISFISLINPDLLASYNYFSVGGLSGVSVDSLVIPAIIITICLILTIVFSRRIDVLCLGDVTAHSLGVNVTAFRIFCLLLASASAASVVSFAGLLGFVGLIVPHMARRITGKSFRYSIPVCVLMGSITVLVADMLGRVLFAPSEMPVGIIMALVGAPFFLWLLIKRRHYDIG